MPTNNFLKDHLGNIRVVLTADPNNIEPNSSNVVTYMATMEAPSGSPQGGEVAANESLYFANIDETRADKPYNYPDHNPLNQKVAKVPGKSKGPSITLKVMAGDTVTISAKAFYNMDKTLPGKGVDIVPIVGSAIAAMTNPTGTVLGEAAQLATDLGTTASQSVALLPASPPSEGPGEAKPKAGLNFVLYNDAFNIIEANTGVLVVEDKINEIQTLATDKMVMQESGFLEIYVNNEAQTPVYFDNLMATQTKGPVVEINAYYPYGMIIPNLGTMAEPDKKNAYKYNGKEMQDLENFKTGWLDYGARMLDPAVGRWWVPDPLAEWRYSINPFAYASNNSVNRIDPTGMLDGWYEDELKKIIYDANINSQQDLKNAGIEGNYLGDTGYGIDEATGDAIRYNPDGTTKEFAQTLSGITVTPTVSYPTKNPSLSSNNQTGYVWDNKDLAVWNSLENSDSPIGKVVRLQVETGNYDILSAENYWNTYGDMLGQFYVGAFYLKMINGLAPGPNSVSYKGRGFSGMKVTTTKSASTSSEYIPTFNEFRAANKGTFTGHKGQGTSTKKAWEAYKAKYGDKARMY